MLGQGAAAPGAAGAPGRLAEQACWWGPRWAPLGPTAGHAATAQASRLLQLPAHAMTCTRSLARRPVHTQWASPRCSWMTHRGRILRAALGVCRLRSGTLLEMKRAVCRPTDI